MKHDKLTAEELFICGMCENYVCEDEPRGVCRLLMQGWLKRADECATRHEPVDDYDLALAAAKAIVEYDEECCSGWVEVKE